MRPTVKRQPSILTGVAGCPLILASRFVPYSQRQTGNNFCIRDMNVMHELLTLCRTFGLCLCFSFLAWGQTLPKDGGFTLNDAGTVLRLRARLLLDAQPDGFMSIKEVVPAPDQKHFAVIACGYECNDNIGFVFRADGGGKRKFTARWDVILQNAVEWSADGRQLYYYRINSSGAEAPRRAPAEGWVSVDVRTGAKSVARTRQLKTTANYAVFNVRHDDVLRVRTRPAAQAQSLGALAHDAKDVRVTGAAVRDGSISWVPIRANRVNGANELTGWVNQSYLREERAAARPN